MAEKKSWRDYSKNHAKDNNAEDNKSTSGSKASNDWRSYSKHDGRTIVGNTVTNRVNAWLENHNNYLSDYNNRYSGRKFNYEDAYVSDSSDWLDTVTKQKSAFDAEADSILAYMDQHKGYLDSEWMEKVRKTLTDARNTQGQVLDYTTKDNEWWSGFGSEELLKQYGSAEEAYKYHQRADGYSKKYDGQTYADLSKVLETMDDGEEKEWLTSHASSVDYDEKSKFDTEAGAKEVEDLKGILDQMDSMKNKISFLKNTPSYAPGMQANASNLAYYESELAKLEEQYGSYDSIKSQLSQKNAYLNQATRVQNGIKLASVADSTSENYDQEFSQYAGYVDSDKMPLVPDYKDIVYGIINGDQDAKDGRTMATAWSKLSDSEKKRLDAVQYMTEEEKALYNYYYNKHGYDAAEEYLDSILDSLNYLHGKEMFGGMEGKVLAEELFGIAAGFDQANSGLQSLFSDKDYIPTSATQYASGMVREDLKDVGFKMPDWMGGASLGQGIYDLTTTTANMAPSIMASIAANAVLPGSGAVVGSALMGASSAGNAYQEALNLGYDKDQARAYSTLVGASEAGLQYLMGGIGKLGGKITGKTAASLASKFDNAFARLAVQYGMNMLSEGGEEYLQEILTPMFKNLALGTDEEINLISEEAIYSFLLGAITSGVMEGGSTINTALDMRSGSKVNTEAVNLYGGSTSELIQEGLASDPGSESHQFAEIMQRKTDKGKSMSGYEIRQQVQANEAQFAVEDYNSAVETAKDRLTELGETKDVDKVAKLVAKKVTGQDLTRSEIKALVNGFGSQVAKEMTESAEQSKLTYKSLEDRIGTGGRFGVSKSGQATVRATNEAIDLAKAEVVKVGESQITFKTEDGTEVYAGDIDFADEDQSYLVSAVSDIENITPAAATAVIHDIVDASKPLGSQLNGIDEAYTYGYHGYSVEDLKAGNHVSTLTDKQMMSAYKLGESARKISDTEADAPRIKMRTAAEAKLTAKQKTEKQKARFESDDVEVYFHDGKTSTKFEDSGKYSPQQMAAVNYAKLLSKLRIGGSGYHFYESYVNDDEVRVYKDANGNEVKAPNGMYMASDGSIWIDLNAGDRGQGTTLFTLGHELTHFIKQWSKEKFKVLADFLIEEYGKTDMSMHQRVLEKQGQLEDIRGEDVSYDEAFEEVVADAMSTMLTDGNLHEKLAKLKSKDKGLFNKIKQFFDKMIAKFQALYKGLDPEQKDARDVRAMKDAFERIQQAFAEALVEASDNFHAAMESVVEANAEPVGADEIITEGAVVTDGEGVRHSIRSMKHDIADGKMFRDLMDVCGWTQAQVGTLRTQLKDLVEYMVPYRNILDMNENYGAEGRRFSPYKPNSDPLYKISMDFSTLCSKRLLTQYVIEQLQLRENRPMSAEEQMAIRDMLNEYRKVEKGLQVACSMCYVEAARLKAPRQIQRWLNNPAPLLTDYFGKKNKAFNDAVKKAQADFKESKGYDREAPKKDMKPADVKELNKIGPKMRSQYQPSAEEQAIIDRAKTLPNSTYLTAGNLADLSETDPVIYDAYTAFVRTATRSKSLEKDEPYYYGDSTRDNGNGIVVTDSFIEAVNRENGMRFSSWSDWRIQHLLDYITAVIDNSVRGAAMHGYTKFGDEVRVLGKTGMMFNMSGVTGTQTGLNEDGSLNFSETESIDVNEAIQLREEFPDTAGLQCIGVSDQHIVALLRSDIIDYVIPYHVSGLNADLRRMAKIYGWDDYTGTQHAAIDKSIKFENAVGKEHWHEEPVFSEFFVGYDTGMTGIEAMRASAEKYKQMCKDRGLTPKFNQFATEENYWKLLIDRKMINQQTGKLIRQKAVTPTFDFDTIKGVVDKFVDNYDAGLEARALNHIVENWDTLPQRIKDLKKQGGTKAKKTKKAAATLANQTVAAQPAKNSDRGAKYSWRNDSKGNKYWYIDTQKDIFKGLKTTQEYEDAAFKYLLGQRDKNVVVDAIDGKKMTFIRLSAEEFTRSEESQDLMQNNPVMFAQKMRLIPSLDDLAANANVNWWSPDHKSHKLFKAGGFENFRGRVGIDDVVFNFVIRAGKAKFGDIFYDINLEVDQFLPHAKGASEINGSTSSNKRVTQPTPKVNTNSGKNSDRYEKIASDFTSHMESIVANGKGWYANDVFKYVEEHPELGFIELIYAKDKDAKKLLEKFLGGIDDVKVLDQLSWFMGEAYGDKDRTWSWSGGAQYPYRGAVRTFRNAIKKRINAIMSENVGGTNLGIKNGEVELADIKSLYSKLNANEEIGQFAEKVFATAEKLGVNIRFTNQTMAKNVAGDNLGDMVEYKTSYFNDTAVSDQRKANTLLHELIHACTVYVMQHNPTAGDVHYSGIFSENWNNISNAATRLNRIYSEIERDPDFKGQYGITNAKEMVAELANEEFVGLLKKKNLWDRIVDWICELFGYRRGNSAYENARMCVDYILDNPEIDVYKNQSAIERRNAKYNGYDVFGQTRYSERNNAPVFYSQMGKVVEGMKQEKFGASSVISMLRGRGVKAEEIRWSGIQAFLEGKKSVTKAELLEFIKGSMLHIEEQELGSTGKPELWDDFYRQMEDVIPYFHQEEIEEMCFDYDGEFSAAKFETELREYVEDGTISEDDFEEAMEYAEEMGQSLKNKSGTQWSQYKLDGGSNYRELLFKMPSSDYTNQAMQSHWGNDAQGVLAHARMQDFEVDGKQMLFIEEIQSDWHNAGHKHGYMDGTSAAQYEELKDRVEIARSAVSDAYTKYSRIEGELGDLIINFRSKNDAAIEKWNRDVDAAKERVEEARLAHVQARHEYVELSTELQKLAGKVPDTPFKDNYHEYVLKRLIRMAAEEGYDSIGWTTADIQSDRWSDDYAEGYRIEYDQDIPKFLKKYGKQWGATVGKTNVGAYSYDIPAETEVPADMDDDMWLLREEMHIEEPGTEIWSMDITPAMKQSVLEEGQALYSERTGDSVSNRSLLANALEGITQSSSEYKLIQQYKGYIAELNSLDKKLSEMNAEIRKIRFGTKGARDTERLARLESEAKKIAEAINRYDQKLLWLEASEPIRKVIERERKKEAQKTKDHVKEIQQTKKVRAEQTELRHKIRKAVRDLDKLLNRGNKKLNVKEDVQGVVSKALKAADILFTDHYGNYDMLRNGIGADLSDAEETLVATCTRMLKDLDKMPTDGYDNFMARQEAEKKLSIKMAKLKDVFARERKRLNNTTVSSILGELADAYASLEKSEQSYVQGAYIEAVHSFLKNLQSEVGGTVVSDMTKDQLESVYAAYKMVLTTVRKANQLFNEGLKMSREQLGNAVIQEVMLAGGRHGLWTKAEIARSQFDWNNMKPVWVANRIGSESFGKLWQGLFEGQYNFAKDIEEAKQFKLEMDKKYKPRSWDAEKQYKFMSSTGKEFSLNLQQIMSLYAFSKREQAYSHLLNGGFVFEGNSTVIVDEKGRKKTYIHNGATSYKLNEATLNGIINSLTKEQIAYVDEMQKYLSEVMGEKGNEVSMQLYGIKMFKEQFYFPLRSSGAYMERAKEAELKKQQGQINLVNSGFTHAVKPEAKNPIILSGFMDVWAEHCNEMSMYHSMVLPMEDFRKVYNYSTVHDEKFESASVFQTIQDAYGNAATAYIDQLYRELNAGATVDPRETPWKARISKFKKASVMMSASVVVQQFSAIGRAYAMIDPKHFIGVRVNSDTKLSAAEEMKKYAPVAIIKEMGGFDTGTKGSAKSYIMAETYGKGERLQGLKKEEQYRSDLMGYLPAKADEKTWCAIWEAAKRETKAKHPKMDVKSEEFLKLAGERFSEVIEKTQVYDSVLARSANMRSKGAFMAMATAFMAEPTTTINLIEDAIRSGDKKHMARVFGSVAVSIVLNNALASIVYAMRDDDEDETFIEKYAQSFASGMIDDFNPMSYYPFLKDVYSLFQGYDVERSDMSVIADVRDALKKAISVIGKDTSEMDDEQLAEHYKTITSALMSVVDAGCSMFGVPFKNVRRDANGLVNAVTTTWKDMTERDTTWISFWDKIGAAAKDTVPILAWTKDKAKADKLYTAIINGDQEYLARLKNGYKTDSAYQSAVRKALRENDPRIHEAAQARYEGRTEEYKRIFREIKNEGKFSFDEIMDAVNSEENAIRNKLEPDKATSQYSASDFVEAIVLGEAKNAKAMRDDIINAHMANDMSMAEAEEAFVSSVTSSIGDAYSSGLLDKAGAENMLIEYAGKDEEEAASKVNYWAFCEKYPQYDLSESRVAKFYEFAEPAGVSVDVYAQFINGTKDMGTIYDEWGDEVESKRDQVLDFIDSLPLTWQQKDALYLAFGYKESRIWDVPW